MIRCENCGRLAYAGSLMTDDEKHWHFNRFRCWVFKRFGWLWERGRGR